MGQINQGFPNLFGQGDKEDSEQVDEGETDETGAGDAFQDKWGWIANVDNVSETCRCSWDAVWEMTALEFLNILAYRKDKTEKEKADIERWKRRN